MPHERQAFFLSRLCPSYSLLAKSLIPLFLPLPLNFRQSVAESGRKGQELCLLSFAWRTNLL